MADKVKELLTKEIERSIQSLATVSGDTDEYDTMCANLLKIYKLRVDEEKLIADQEKLKLDEKKLKLEEAKAEHEKEHDEKKLKLEKEKAEREVEISEREMLEKITARIWQSGLRVAEIVIPAALYAWLMMKGFEFEENGYVSSTFFRSLINKTKPDKK